jgi:phenylpropionate dioxygenase-like ring-hydroxylating dioxygenase large terminal subunit
MNFVSKPESGGVPFEITQPDRIPAQRYYDKEFYELENERLWPHVWQMACRLEEIPNPGDYSVYRILDKSVIVIRTDASTIKAYNNHCRHRGVELVQTQGHTSGGFICPFHGWRWDANGNNTFVYAEQAFSEANLCKDDLNLVGVRVDTWGGCAFINFDNDAPPLRESLGSFATRMDAWGVEDLKVDWWMSTRLPCNWKLAMEAFMEGYHVATTHPQLLPPGVTSRPGDAIWVKVPEEHATVSLWMTTASKQMPTEMDAREFIELNIRFMDLLSDGMAGMTHKQEVAIAKKMLDLDLPKDPSVAAGVWRTALHNAVMDYYKDIGAPTPDLNEVDRKGYAVGVNFCFPHYFLLPTYGSASSYRIRPLGPEECLFELWSLTRFPANEQRPRPQPPMPKPHDDQDWPPIPRQDFANLPKQQRGLHAGFEYMRLSHEMEGLISNYQRTIDGYLRGAPTDRLLAALQEASGPIDVPVADLGLQVETPVS